MAYEVFIFHTNGKIDRSVQSHKPAYDQIKTAVGGYIQECPGFNRYENFKRGTAFCHEEGKLIGLPYNVNATNAWVKSCEMSGKPFDRSMCLLVGPVIYYCKVPAIRE